MKIIEGSEYTSGFNYARILNIPEFYIWQGYTVTQGSEYVWIPEYGRICGNMWKYAKICVNGFGFTFPHFPICFAIPFLHEQVVVYLNV